MTASAIGGANDERISAWQSQMASLLKGHDAGAQVAAHLIALEALQLEPTTKARVVAEVMTGSQAGVARTNAVQSSGVRELANALGSGLLDALRLAKTVIAGKNETVDEQRALAAEMKTVARGELAQVVAAYLRAANPDRLTAIELASSKDGPTLVFTSNATFFVREGAAYSQDRVFDYSNPNVTHFSDLGVTRSSLDELLAEKVRRISVGETLETTSLQDLPRWSSMKSNVMQLDLGRAAGGVDVDQLLPAMRRRAEQALVANEARIRSMGDAKAVFGQLNYLFEHDEGVRALRDHLERMPDKGQGVGLQISYDIALTRDGFVHVDTQSSDSYKRGGLLYRDRTTSFSVLSETDVLAARIKQPQVDAALEKLLHALTEHNRGADGEMSWLVKRVGTKADCISE